MALRVNAQQSSAPDYVAALAAAGIAAKAISPWGIELERAVPVAQLPGFAEGRVSVQDAAAQMAAPLLLQGLGNPGALRVLDACAAPGGKTGHLLEAGVGEVTALELDAGRCARIHQNLERLRLSARVVCADAGQPQTWWDGRRFDAILLDAPCTASGITRRHPDVRCCAARPMWPSSPSCSRGCWPRSGPCWSPADVCCIAPARYSGRKGRARSKRFLHTTPTPHCCPRRAI